MSDANPRWGAPRIHGELLKLGIEVSQSTVPKYLGRRQRPPSQTWRTFLANHVGQIMAADFFVVPTATGRLLFVLVILAHARRRIVRVAVTEHPTAEWTVQQFRAFVTGDEPYRFVIHDRDAIYSSAVDRALASMHLRVLTTPVHTPQANAVCERLIGTARRECLDFMIPLNERHLRRILVEWVQHYNRGRPHASLGPGIPDRPSSVAPRSIGQLIPHGYRVAAIPILGDLHHEYRLEAATA